METKEIKKNFKESFNKAIMLSLISIACVYICSAASGILASNFSSNFGYNMGVASSILNGAVPYKDVYTNLGPLALMTYSLFNIVTKFNLLLFLEVICAIAFVLIINRIFTKFLSNYTAVVATAVSAVLTYTCSAFVLGGTVEELLLPFFAYLLLCLVELSVENKHFSAFRVVMVSISLALIVWTKFSLIVFPVLFLVAYIALSIKNKQTKTMFMHLLVFAFVMVVVSMLMVWYLYIQKCLTDFAGCYFVGAVNFSATLKNLADNLFLVAFAIFGIVMAFIKHRQNLLEVSILAIVYLVSILFTAVENVTVLPLSVISMLGVCFAFEMLDNGNLLKRSKYIAKTVILIMTIVYCLIFSNAIWTKNSPKVNQAQNQIVTAIANYELENPTLLCYKTDSYGLYNNTGISMGTRVFANNGIVENVEELRIEFDIALLEQKTDFILMEKDIYQANKKTISNYYKQVKDYTITSVDNFITTETDVVLLIKKTTN